MIPNMFKIAGELLPGVFQVAAVRLQRAPSISLVTTVTSWPAVRWDLHDGLRWCPGGPRSFGRMHLSAIRGRVPFLNFFDGFRTSHEIQKVELLDYDDLKKLVDQDALARFRRESMNPIHQSSAVRPKTRTSTSRPARP